MGVISQPPGRLLSGSLRLAGESLMSGGLLSSKSIRKLSSLKYSSRLLFNSKGRHSKGSINILTLRSIRRGILLLLVDKKVS